jgi:hypothetical protein
MITQGQRILNWYSQGHSHCSFSAVPLKPAALLFHFKSTLNKLENLTDTKAIIAHLYCKNIKNYNMHLASFQQWVQTLA